jgi:hypothetical protein
VIGVTVNAEVSWLCRSRCEELSRKSAEISEKLARLDFEVCVKHCMTIHEMTLRAVEYAEERCREEVDSEHLHSCVRFYLNLFLYAADSIDYGSLEEHLRIIARSRYRVGL